MNEFFSDISIMQLMIMLVPLIIIQFSLILFAILQLNKYGVKNLSKTVWIIIILFVNTIGPILFLLIGRNSHD